MQKFTSVEKVKILSPESHEIIARGLAKTASHKVEDLDDSDKEQILKEISDDGIDG